MADVMNTVHLHFVWSTYDRHPKLTPLVQEVAYQQIAAACQTMGCDVKAIGGVEDHVHVIVRFATTVSISDLVKRMKGTSAHFLNQSVPECEKSFKWQGGYGVFPVEPDSLLYAVRYVEQQKEHHSARSLDARYEPATSYSKAETEKEASPL